MYLSTTWRKKMYCLIYTDELGGRVIEKFSKFGNGYQNLKEANKKLIELKNNGARGGAIYREPFHSTADRKALVSYFGDGSYWDNVSKSDPSVRKKKA